MPVSLQAGGLAPSAVKSVTLDFNWVKATYPDDLGDERITLTAADFKGPVFSYKKVSKNTGVITFRKWVQGSEVYSGTFTLDFETRTSGTSREDYTGSYAGFIDGTFEITNLDSPKRPKALPATVKVKAGGKKSFKLKGKGEDIGTRLKYKVTRKPKVGKLVTNKLPKVVYKAPKGFKGTVKFTYIVKEGKTKSKPATVKLRVR